MKPSLFHLVHVSFALQTYCGLPWRHRGNRPRYAKLPDDIQDVTCKQCQRAWAKLNPTISTER